MTDRGAHTITGGGDPPKQPAFEDSGCGTIFAVIFWIVIIVGGISKCAEPDPPAPMPPSQPAPKTATFYSSDPSHPNPIILTIQGGSYALTYSQISKGAAMRLARSDEGVFLADYATGKTYGNLETAKKIVILGSPRLEVGSFG